MVTRDNTGSSATASGEEKLLIQLGELTATITQLQSTVASLAEQLGRRDEELRRRDEQVAELRRALFGRKSERMPEVKSVLRRRARKAGGQGSQDESQKAAKKKRAARRTERAELPEVVVEHAVKDCVSCGSDDMQDLNSSEDASEYEYVAARLVRKRHVRRKGRCNVCNKVTTAAGSAKVVDGGHYGPGLYAHAVTAKCADSLPLHRLAKSFERGGVPMSRSTLTDLFHRAAELLEPLAKRILMRVSEASKVNADETPIAIQARKKCRRGYVWTFLAEDEKLIGFIYSATRSGQVPAKLLGDTTGILQTDAYAGYNTVLVPSGRERISCLAHIRRYFYKALDTAPDDAQAAIEQILSLYEVEYMAAEEEALGTARHLAMRKAMTYERLQKLETWVTDTKPKHPPRSPLGKALSYAEKNLPQLYAVCHDVTLRLDNNLAENALRLIALGRKNFLFLGNDAAGNNFAILQTLVSTCLVNDVNPQEEPTE